MMQTQDAVLTVAHRMPYAQMDAFVRSLKATGYAGRTVFFCSLTDGETLRKLREQGVEVVEFFFCARHVRQPLARFWPVWRWLFSLGLPGAVQDFMCRRAMHLFFLRHLLYLRYLEKNPGIGRVLMSDCRDVYFQGDPFSDWPGPGLHAFEEDRSTLIGQCRFHREWLGEFGGAATLDRLAGEARFCAGTIMGDRSSVIPFLEIMVAATKLLPTFRSYGGDQGLYNILAHEGRIPHLVRHGNDESVVYTVGGVPREEVRLDADGYVVNDRGYRAPVLHQYDRRPGAAQSLLAKLG